MEFCIHFQFQEIKPGFMKKKSDKYLPNSNFLDFKEKHLKFPLQVVSKL